MSEILNEELQSANPQQAHIPTDNSSVKVSTRAKYMGAVFGKENRKGMIVVWGVIAFVLASVVYVFALAGKDAPRGGAGTVEGVNKKTIRSNSNEQSIVVRESIERYNEEVLPELQASNPYAHPIVASINENDYGDDDDDDYESPFIAFDQPEAINTPIQTGASTANETQEQYQQQQQQQQQQQYRISEQQTQMAETLIAKLIEQEGDTPAPLNASWTYTASSRSSGSVYDDDDDSDADSDFSSDKGKKLCEYKSVRAGTVLYATSDLALNSDVGGAVSVTVRSGVLAGYKMLGSFERKEKWLRIALDKLVEPDGITGIDAVALDMETTLNAVQGKVNYHTIYRYGWWGFGTVLSAIGKAAETNENTTVHHVDGSAIESRTKDTNRELKLALGALGTQLGEVMQERLNRPITVTMKANDEVGVFLLDDICVR